MALPVNIDDLINHRKVECARIEYKEGWNPERVLHTLCAFANDFDNWGGGYVILGVAEKDGKPVFPVKGLPTASVDRIQKELLGVCHLIEPLYLPVVEPVEYQGKTLLVVWAPGGCERPYSCPERILKKGKSPKAYFIRKMASTVKASRLIERELFEMAGDVPFDDRPNMQADVADLKVNLMADYLREVGSDLYPAAEEMSSLELAKRLRLVSGAEELVKPLNVGLMFFNPHPENFFRYAWIEVVDKPDPTGQGMVEKTFKGPLHIQLRSALDYIKSYILKEKIYKVSGRAEADRHWNYPYDAVEEALANAVYHKSYQLAEPVVVTFTPDRMEINNNPGPDRSIRKADLSKYRLCARTERNRRIGQFLKDVELAEGRNTGYPTILRALKHNGSSMPKIETDAARTYFTFMLPIHPSFREDDKKVALGEKKVALGEKKVALGEKKVALGEKKVALVPFEDRIAALKLTKPTEANILRMYSLFGLDRSFSRLQVINEMPMKRAAAWKFLAKLHALGLTEPVIGDGRGHYKFRA